MHDSLVLSTPHGSATVHPLGATVLSWLPAGQPDVLWVSPLATYREGRAIRGGIPVCWPWFAADPAHPQGPSHGLVRTRLWQLDDHSTGGDTAHARWHIDHDDASVFPPFRLELSVTLGVDLTLRLTHHDRSGSGAACRGALHSYLAADARGATVQGLGAVRAYDKVTQRHRRLPEPVAFDGPTDLVVPTAGLATLHDGHRRIEVHRHEAPDVVLWNPGNQRPSDVPEGGEAGFVCVEAAAVTEPWHVAAGGHRSLQMRLVAR